MVKLIEQAYDTEELYGHLGVKQMEEIAIKTGLCNGTDNLDARILLSIFQNTCRSTPRALEVGCGYGRIGQVFMQNPEIEYWGIELHKPFVDSFRSKIKDKEKVLQGNFLDYHFPLDKLGCVLFPWSVIADFSSDIGQVSALQKARSLLIEEGRVLIDVPKDVVNKFEGIEPGYFNVHERYNLEAMGLQYMRSHEYTTFTGRNREVIEISAK